MEIKPGRMVHLGYGKYWRSDDIVGLRPIENGRGPGRRTEVFVASHDGPLLASRGERAILHDMADAGGAPAGAEVRRFLDDLLGELGRVSPALRMILESEAGVSLDRIERRARALADATAEHPSAAQPDLFD